jgi:hypothetical protein
VTERQPRWYWHCHQVLHICLRIPSSTRHDPAIDAVGIYQGTRVGNLPLHKPQYRYLAVSTPSFVCYKAKSYYTTFCGDWKGAKNTETIIKESTMSQGPQQGSGIRMMYTMMRQRIDSFFGHSFLAAFYKSLRWPQGNLLSATEFFSSVIANPPPQWFHALALIKSAA